jgi:uncharacterized membrane protein YfcA
MHFYLPVAEMSANILIFLAMGGAVGFLSGLFGVGGGFLMTPLLIFSGIPPAVAVGTESAQITASSVSGAFAQWRRRNIDFTMGTVLLAGGIVGSVLGVQLVGSLRRLGVFDFFVAACYVTFLGVVGTLMLIESVNTMRKMRCGTSVSSRRSGQHMWIHGLPLKLRFQRSSSTSAPSAVSSACSWPGRHRGRGRRLHHGASDDFSAGAHHVVGTSLSRSYS